MFSDLPDETLNNTWYETANNSLLWKNTFSWLAEVSVDEPVTTIPVDQLMLIIGGITGTGILISIAGVLLYWIGSGRRISIVRAEVPKPKSSDEKEIVAKSKGSRRDRRFQQIQKKNTKRRK